MKIKLYFDKVSLFHDGYCSGAECEYEIEDNSKTMVVVDKELLEKYQGEDEIPVTHELRMKYIYSLSEERHDQKYSLSGCCDKPPTNDDRINFVLENFCVCNENTYLLTRIEVLADS